MITITERAAAGLQELLAINHRAPCQSLKLVQGGPGRFDEARLDRETSVAAGRRKWSSPCGRNPDPAWRLSAA
jgi:hypothetical protein